MDAQTEWSAPIAHEFSVFDVGGAMEYTWDVAQEITFIKIRVVQCVEESGVQIGSLSELTLY